MSDKSQRLYDCLTEIDDELVEEAADWLGLEVIGLVYEDENLIACNNRGVPMAFKRSTITSQCYTVIAQRLLGEKAVLPKFKEKNIIRAGYAYECSRTYETPELAKQAEKEAQ